MFTTVSNFWLGRDHGYAKAPPSRNRKCIPGHTRRNGLPGVGVLHPCIDRVTIVSPFSVGRLKQRLPISDLKQASHAFEVISPKRFNPRVGSVLLLTGTNSLNPWLILKKHEDELGGYSVVEAEIAFDVPAKSIADAHKRLLAVVGRLGKYRHQRGHLWSKHEPDRTPPAGRVPEPTFYFEERKSGVTLKCYVRLEKLPGGGFVDPIVRLEWTLKGKPALERHLGGNQLKHLLRADLNAFLKHNLRLEQVDRVAFGKLFHWRPR